MKFLTVLLPLVLLLILGCNIDQIDVENRYGSAYTLLQTQSLPIITTDSIFVRVGYSGCNGNQTFVLRYRIYSSTAEVWLFKVTPGQPCDAYFEETKSFELSNEIRNSAKVILNGPLDNRFRLK